MIFYCSSVQITQIEEPYKDLGFFFFSLSLVIFNEANNKGRQVLKTQGYIHSYASIITQFIKHKIYIYY